jgi:hypothetical protein
LSIQVSSVRVWTKMSKPKTLNVQVS